MTKNTQTLIVALGLLCANIATAQTTIFSEDFEGGSMPTGWTQTTSASDGGWLIGTGASLSSGSFTFNSSNTGTFAGSNDDACNCDKSSDVLVSASFDLSSYTSVLMSVDVFYYNASYQGDQEAASIEISSNGGTTWSTLGTLVGAGDWQPLGYDLSTYAGNSDVKLRFSYSDAGGWLYGIGIDNVVVFEPGNDVEMTSINMLDWALMSDGAQPVTGTLTNKGVTLTSVDITWTIDGGAANTESLTGLNVAPFDTYDFTHSDTWTPPATGTYALEVTLSNPNGSTDVNLGDNDDNLDILVVNSYVPRKVLFENFTSSTCGPCAPANATMLGLIGKDPEAGSFADVWTVVKYQMSWPTNGDPYYTAEGGTRRSYYSVSSVPNLWLDGGWGLNGNSLTASVINTYAAVPSFLEISATHTISGQTVSCDVSVDAVENYSAFSSTNLVLHMAIVEKETHNNEEPTGAPTYGNGEKDFQFVMKKMMPNASGTSVGPFSVGTTVTASETYTFNGSYVLPVDANSPANLAVEHTVEEFSDLIVVVWVQDNNTKEVLQSTWSEYNCGLASSTSVDADCGSANGSATATTTGSGTVYLWDDGSAQTTATATNLAAGIYTCVISDPLGCTVSTTIAVNNNGGPTVLTQVIDNQCSDGSTGIVNLIVSGGSSPYTYSWSGGGNTQNMTGLANGSYTVTVTDAAGCNTFKTATVEGNDPILINGTITEAIGADGAVNLSVTGGTPNYAYSWDNGATTQDISGVVAGTYNVTITDGFGCTAEESYVVPQGSGTSVATVEGLTELNVYPNPFSNTATVEFSLNGESKVSVDVLSVVGELVYTENHGTVSGGTHKVQIAGGDLAPGIYFVKIAFGENVVTRKIIRN